jgi:ribosome recycling factor
MLEAIKKESTEKMHKAIVALEHHFETLRTGRASLAILENITVPAYGTDSSLNQVASLSTPDAKTIAIQPWDKTILGVIEKALLGANLGVTPTNDGTVVRLVFPPLTEERRKEVVKVAHKMAEEARVSVRNVRRHVNEEIKKKEKTHEISEDDRDKLIKDIQKLTDDYVAKVDELTVVKEKDILEV